MFKFIRFSSVYSELNVALTHKICSKKEEDFHNFTHNKTRVSIFELTQVKRFHLRAAPLVTLQVSVIIFSAVRHLV